MDSVNIVNRMCQESAHPIERYKPWHVGPRQQCSHGDIDDNHSYLEDCSRNRRRALFRGLT